MALLIQRKAAKELAGVPREEWERLRERLESIARNPRARHPGVELLTGRDRDHDDLVDQDADGMEGTPR